MNTIWHDIHISFLIFKISLLHCNVLSSKLEILHSNQSEFVFLCCEFIKFTFKYIFIICIFLFLILSQRPFSGIGRVLAP